MSVLDTFPWNWTTYPDTQPVISVTLPAGTKGLTVAIGTNYMEDSDFPSACEQHNGTSYVPMTLVGEHHGDDTAQVYTGPHAQMWFLENPSIEAARNIRLTIGSGIGILFGATISALTDTTLRNQATASELFNHTTDTIQPSVAVPSVSGDTVVGVFAIGHNANGYNNALVRAFDQTEDEDIFVDFISGSALDCLVLGGHGTAAGSSTTLSATLDDFTMYWAGIGASFYTPAGASAPPGLKAMQAVQRASNW